MTQSNGFHAAARAIQSPASRIQFSGVAIERLDDKVRRSPGSDQLAQTCALAKTVGDSTLLGLNPVAIPPDRASGGLQ